MGARTGLNRRTFLRGLGGAAVAAPFLASVAERAGKGQTPTRPKQLIVMFTHNGCVTTQFFPVKSHGTLAAADLESTNLAALAPFARKLLIPRGMRAMNEWTKDNNGSDGRGQGNDRYDMAAGSYFTLEPITPNKNDVWGFDTNTRFSPRPIGKSLDHVIAQQISTSGFPLLMRVGNTGATGATPYHISFTKPDGAARTADATVYPGLGTPTQIFSQLTGLFGSGPMNADTREMIRGKKMCDVVKDDLAAFERQDMSAEDRNKVAVWKALCNDMGTIVTSACSMDLATRLGATTETVAAATTRVTGTDLLTNKITAELDGADMYSVMAVLAAACNYNPVIFLKYPLDHIFTGLGISVNAVALSHRLDNAGLTGPCLPNALTMLQAIDRYHAAKFAKLIGMLDGIDNGDGSKLLDSTATVWFNQFSDGLAGNLNNLPVIQAGGCGGYFKTGWTVNVDTGDPGSPTLTRGNSEAQCADGTASGKVDGVSAGTGTDPSVANGPINKYFYNLMNAVGVKADASGFPAKGGTAEVSRFGYSDRTTDFNGGFGAVAGATIHDPGEYTALKSGS
jgi:hypothetical protein